MTERDAFIRKICEVPADDTPRLVYADWLDEFGDEADREQAAFIRQKFPPVPPSLRCRSREAQRWSRYARGLVGDTLPKMYTRWLLPTPGSVTWHKKLRTYGPDAWVTALSVRRIESGRPPCLLALRHGLISAVAMNQHAFWNYGVNLFQTQPIEQVVLRGVRPDFDGRWCWPMRMSYTTNGLHPNMWARLTRGEKVDNRRRYLSMPEALKDLSDACVSFGRDLAGLPPLLSQDGRSAPQTTQKPNDDPNASGANP